MLRVLLLAGFSVPLALVPPPLKASAQTDPGKPSIQERLKRVSGDLFSGTDRVSESIEELKSILALDPRSTEAHLLLGIAYRAAGSPDLLGEAVAELRQALDLDPALVPARLYLAYLYLDLGRPQRAREELEAALARAPGQPQLLTLLGDTERQLGNPTRAVEVLERALKSDGTSAQARYYLGLALLDLKRHDEAIAELEHVVASNPNMVEPYLSLGMAYLDAARTDDAVRSLRRAEQIAPRRPEVHVQLARAYRLERLLKQAEQHLTIAASARSTNPGTAFSRFQQVELDLYFEQGLLRLAQGRLEAAAEAFQKVLDMDIDHQDARQHLAEVRRRLNESQKKPPKDAP